MKIKKRKGKLNISISYIKKEITNELIVQDDRKKLSQNSYSVTIVFKILDEIIDSASGFLTKSIQKSLKFVLLPQHNCRGCRKRSFLRILRLVGQIQPQVLQPRCIL